MAGWESIDQVLVQEIVKRNDPLYKLRMQVVQENLESAQQIAQESAEVQAWWEKNSVDFIKLSSGDAGQETFNRMVDSMSKLSFNTALPFIEVMQEVGQDIATTARQEEADIEEEAALAAEREQNIHQNYNYLLAFETMYETGGKGIFSILTGATHDEYMGYLAGKTDEEKKKALGIRTLFDKDETEFRLQVNKISDTLIKKKEMSIASQTRFRKLTSQHAANTAWALNQDLGPGFVTWYGKHALSHMSSAETRDAYKDYEAEHKEDLGEVYREFGFVKDIEIDKDVTVGPPEIRTALGIADTERIVKATTHGGTILEENKGNYIRTIMGISAESIGNEVYGMAKSSGLDESIAAIRAQAAMLTWQGYQTQMQTSIIARGPGGQAFRTEAETYEPYWLISTDEARKRFLDTTVIDIRTATDEELMAKAKDIAESDNKWDAISENVDRIRRKMKSKDPEIKAEGRAEAEMLLAKLSPQHRYGSVEETYDVFSDKAKIVEGIATVIATDLGLDVSELDYYSDPESEENQLKKVDKEKTIPLRLKMEPIFNFFNISVEPE